MGSILIFFAALFAFAFSSRGLINSLTENVTLISLSTGYTKQATRIGKGYKVTAWLMLTMFLFFTTVQSFIVLFSDL
jgi:hypothetical protein